MADRPVFLPLEHAPFVREEMVTFDWHPGFADSQKQKSIRSLHSRFMAEFETSNILEISSKSESSIGRSLSAFSLCVSVDRVEGKHPVECLFQGSKVFEHGGPYFDLYEASPKQAKTDARIREGGRLIGFSLKGESWPTKPVHAFYDWLYVLALTQNGDLARSMEKFQAFSDIEFNPAKSLNCQARAAARYVGMLRTGVLKKALNSKETFIAAVRGHEREVDQLSLLPD
jgi:hypothetical protein